MLIHTTVNITSDIMLMLDNAARATGKTRSGLIVDVMKKALGDYRRLINPGSGVRYQERAPKGAWKRMHVTILYRDYEYFLDSRKLFKRSVSFLIAYAIRKYLAEVCDNSESTDNYRFKHYLIVQTMVDNVICWKIYWGIPRKKRQILR